MQGIKLNSLQCFITHHAECLCSNYNSFTQHLDCISVALYLYFSYLSIFEYFLMLILHRTSPQQQPLQFPVFETLPATYRQFITCGREKCGLKNRGGSVRQLEVLIHLPVKATINLDLPSSCQNSPACLFPDEYFCCESEL